MIEVWTDGACEDNPGGPGGWAYIVSDGALREESGGDPSTTNNRMEMTAAIKALASLPRGCAVTVYTDSRYVEQPFTDGWLVRWRRLGYRRGKKKALANDDLWRALDAECAVRDVTWRWVRGHAGNAMNERCDELAVAACCDAGGPADDPDESFPSDWMALT